jgi:hypothetical protein
LLQDIGFVSFSVFDTQVLRLMRAGGFAVSLGRTSGERQRSLAATEDRRWHWRDVVAYLPERERPWVWAKLRAAFGQPDADNGMAAAEIFAGVLERQHPASPLPPTVMPASIRRAAAPHLPLASL